MIKNDCYIYSWKVNTNQNILKKKMQNKVNHEETRASFKISGDWEKQSCALRTKYPTLSSDDVKFEVGKETELLKRIEDRLTKNREQVIDILTNIHKDVIEVA